MASAANRRVRDAKALLEARRRFLHDGVQPPGGVPASIRRSWARCAALGLDMDTPPHSEVLSYNQLLEARERNEELVRVARGEMETLDDDARASKSIVVLTDPRGVVIARTGSVEFAERASRVLLRPGVDWGEAAVGTNAIGTALAERQEVCVTGAEHFFEAHRVLNCSAVPIFDPVGGVAGVLDLSNAADVPQTHTLALARRAVEQIERHLFNGRFRDHEQVHFHSEPSLLGSPHEALLAFEDGRLVGANRQALRLLGLDWTALGNMRFDELFDVTRGAILRARSPEETSLKTTRGSTLFARLQPESRSKLMFRGGGDRDPFVEFVPVFDDETLKMLGRAARLLDADLSILVEGEAGTGKEMFARRLHAASRHHDGRFVTVDCAMTDDEALSAELFGDSSRIEGLRGADGGILFLDQVDALSTALQDRLIRCLGDGAPRLGGANPRSRADVVLISTSRQRLSDLAAAGTFRADLLARIAAYTVELEPLRRHPDRAGVISAIWRQVAPPGGAERLQPETLAALAAYAWPGNQRQLVGTLRALAVLARAGEVLGLDTLPHEIRDPRTAAVGAMPAGLNTETGLDSITLTVMRAALAAEKGNVSRAARRLGIHRSTFYRRLFGTDPPNT